MGCDIHLHAEIKVGGQWHHYSHPQIDRDYQLFGKMAGVRDRDETPIAEPRGIPDDATFTTKLDYAHDQGHTPSWLSSSEIHEIIEWMGKREKEWYSPELEQFGFLFGNGWLVDGKDHGHPKELEDVRWVFWFDS